MTDLTELWDKGKLPDGDYYIKRRNGLLLYDNIDSSGVWRNSIDEDIVEVLAPVPSYEEWQEKIEENIKLKTENKWYSEQLNEAVKKIDKLKEQHKIKADCKTLAQKLLQVKPELREWLEVNYKEYL